MFAKDTDISDDDLYANDATWVASSSTRGSDFNTTLIAAYAFDTRPRTSTRTAS